MRTKPLAGLLPNLNGGRPMPGDQPSTAETLPTDEEPHEGMMGEAGREGRKPAGLAVHGRDQASDATDRAALERESHVRRET